MSITKQIGRIRSDDNLVWHYVEPDGTSNCLVMPWTDNRKSQLVDVHPKQPADEARMCGACKWSDQ